MQESTREPLRRTLLLFGGLGLSVALPVLTLVAFDREWAEVTDAVTSGALLWGVMAAVSPGTVKRVVQHAPELLLLIPANSLVGRNFARHPAEAIAIALAVVTLALNVVVIRRARQLLPVATPGE